MNKNTFCKRCNNLLNANTVDTTLIFECLSCGETYESDPSDTLRYEKIEDANMLIYKEILNNSAYDITNSRVYKTCLKCQHNISMVVRLGDEMKIVYICDKCHYQYI